MRATIVLLAFFRPLTSAIRAKPFKIEIHGRGCWGQQSRSRRGRRALGAEGVWSAFCAADLDNAEQIWPRRGTEPPVRCRTSTAKLPEPAFRADLPPWASQHRRSRRSERPSFLGPSQRAERPSIGCAGLSRCHGTHSDPTAAPTRRRRRSGQWPMAGCRSAATRRGKRSREMREGGPKARRTGKVRHSASTDVSLCNKKKTGRRIWRLCSGRERLVASAGSPWPRLASASPGLG
jgi:hypothetical protein